MNQVTNLLWYLSCNVGGTGKTRLAAVFYFHKTDVNDVVSKPSQTRRKREEWKEEDSNWQWNENTAAASTSTNSRVCSSRTWLLITAGKGRGWPKRPIQKLFSRMTQQLPLSSHRSPSRHMMTSNQPSSIRSFSVLTLEARGTLTPPTIHAKTNSLDIRSLHEGESKNEEKKKKLIKKKKKEN